MTIENISFKVADPERLSMEVRISPHIIQGDTA
jgi:hypothetical protein